MILKNVLNDLSPLIHHANHQRSINTSAILYAAPLRKKKVVNPLTTKKQFERKVRRLEKEIARLESVPPKLKPILEYQLPPDVTNELDQRKRTQTDPICHQLLSHYLKIWSIYKGLERKREMEWICFVSDAQSKALKLLQRDYPDLYEKAVQIDPKLIPYRVDVMKKHTPPNPNYKCIDGIKTDITKEWKL